MKRKQKMHIKVGDSVIIIAGSNKNKIGEVIKLYPYSGRIIVKGINFKFKHMKPMKENEVGEIQQVEAPIHHSNVKLNINKL
jgi:large subunit ribosomal protein L24